MGTIEAAGDAVDILKEAGCSVIVGIGHTGWNDDLVTPSANDVTSAEVVKEVPDIDVFVDGHSHSIIDGGNGWICPETETMLSPVCGLRTVLASLCFLSKVPKPGRETLSPLATVSSIASKTALTAAVALVFGISALTATMLMSSDLVMVGSSFLAL